VPCSLDGHAHAVRAREAEGHRHIVGRLGGHGIRGRAVFERVVPARGVEAGRVLLDGEGMVEIREGGAARRTLRVASAVGKRIIHSQKAISEHVGECGPVGIATAVVRSTHS